MSFDHRWYYPENWDAHSIDTLVFHHCQCGLIVLLYDSDRGYFSRFLVSLVMVSDGSRPHKLRSTVDAVLRVWLLFPAGTFEVCIGAVVWLPQIWGFRLYLCCLKMKFHLSINLRKILIMGWMKQCAYHEPDIHHHHHHRRYQSYFQHLATKNKCWH